MQKTTIRIAVALVMLVALALMMSSGAWIPTGYAVTMSLQSPEKAAQESPQIPQMPLSPTFGQGITPLPIDKSPGYKPNPARYLDDWGYEDDSISVRLVKARAYDTDYIVAYVQVADASQLRTTVAGRHNSEDTVRGSVMAKRVNAVLAVNGDFYSYRSGGYIIRQGKQYQNYPNELDTLLIDDKGDFHVIEYATRRKTDDYIASMDTTVVNSFAFGPLLVRDGKRVEEIHYFDVGTTKKTQRMGIAQLGPLRYMCVSTEGPEDPGSAGLTVEEFAALMESLGCDIAYNLDGGSSNTMVFQGEKINSPKNPKIRYIFDIVYFATAIDSGN